MGASLSKPEQADTACLLPKPNFLHLPIRVHELDLRNIKITALIKNLRYMAASKQASKHTHCSPASVRLVSSLDIQFFARALRPCRKIGSGHFHCENWGMFTYGGQ